jgi:phage shock protein PspC (stress-responsive transcriptional regulator)
VPRSAAQLRAIAKRRKEQRTITRVCGGCGRTFEAHPGAVQYLPALRCVACAAKERAEAE